jgi:hypothetical protein
MLLLPQHLISMLGRRQRAARRPGRTPRPTRLPRRTRPLRIQDEPVHLPRPLCNARVVPPWPANRLRATTLSSRAGQTSTHSCYWCGFSVHAHEDPLGYCFGLCKLLADVVSPRPPQSAGHVVYVCAHENSPGYRFALCNLLAR